MRLDRDIAAVSPCHHLSGAQSGWLSWFMVPGTFTQKAKASFRHSAPPTNAGTSIFLTSSSAVTFYYLCSVLGGASRAILAWDIRPQMREADAEIVIQRAREAYPKLGLASLAITGRSLWLKTSRNLSACGRAPHLLCSPYHSVGYNCDIVAKLARLKM